MNQLFEIKGIMKQYSVAKTPQQNRVAERRNRTLIKAARTMLADSKLATTFWAEAFNTACYVQNRVQKIMIMQVKLKRRKNLANITSWYHCGMLIYLFHKSQRVLKMLDSNLLMILERRLMKFQDKKMNVKIKRRRTLLTTLTELMLLVQLLILLAMKLMLLVENQMKMFLDISIFKDSNKDVFGAEADLNNLESTFQVSHIPITRIHKDHPLEQVIRDLHSAPQTKRMNKLDEIRIVIRKKARLVAQGHTQEKGIGYDEVFAPVARIEAIRLFLDYASFKDFVVYQMDVKSAFLYEKIKE
nr:retrovirus-related Pol polyprotein from transposon TNT 1-94 [Tanacetum cinerariifolium]